MNETCNRCSYGSDDYFRRAGFSRAFDIDRRRSASIASREAPSQYSPTERRRRKCRSLFLGRWKEADLSINARWAGLRSDLHDEHRRLGCANGFDRQGPHHVLLFFSNREADHLFIYSSRESRLSAKARLLEGLW